MNLIETLVINSLIVLMLFILWAWDLPEPSLLNRLAWTRLTSLLLFIKPADIEEWLKPPGLF